MIYDRDIREPLFSFLEDEYGKCRILEEKVTGRSRADVVMVTETALYGIEIKSDADTYTRLSGQVKDYDRYYDENIVVVGTRHAMHIEEHVPEYWGIITVEPAEEGAGLDFYYLRRPKQNPKVSWKWKLMLLWRPELAKIQAAFGMPKYKDKGKLMVIDEIIKRIPSVIDEEALELKVCDILLERDYTRVLETLAEYRKSETQKKLDAETDPVKRLQIMMEKPVVGKKKRGRRRKRP